jgi:hypothetical protein
LRPARMCIVPGSSSRWGAHSRSTAHCAARLTSCMYDATKGLDRVRELFGVSGISVRPQSFILVVDASVTMYGEKPRHSAHAGANSPGSSYLFSVRRRLVRARLTCKCRRLCQEACRTSWKHTRGHACRRRQRAAAAYRHAASRQGYRRLGTCSPHHSYTDPPRMQTAQHTGYQRASPTGLRS